MLEVRNLECVRGDHRLFVGLDFTLQAGELLHLRGSNGSGKTSLLRTICGLMSPSAGEVLWQGENVRSHREAYNSGLTYIGHQGGIKDDLTALENLQLHCRLFGINVTEERILDALQQIGLRGREDLPSKVLSQGQKRRVALARLLIHTTKLWVLDEPFNALDVGAVSLLRGLITQHLDAGGLAVLTTHQLIDFDTGSLHEVNLDS